MEKDTIKFTVTEAHLRLLRSMAVRTYAALPDRTPALPAFTCRPAVDARHPFGRSENPVADALDAMGVPQEADGSCSAEDLRRARMLVAELPVAYEAVMSAGRLEPGEYEIPARGGAWEACDGYRCLEWWHEAVDEAVLAGIPVERLCAMLLSYEGDDPAGFLPEMDGQSEYSSAVRDALPIFRRHAAMMEGGA